MYGVVSKWPSTRELEISRLIWRLPANRPEKNLLITKNFNNIF